MAELAGGTPPTNVAAERRRGLILTFAGALVLSPDAVLIRLIGLEPWQLIFWRGTLLSLSLSVVLLLMHGPRAVGSVRAIGLVGVLAGLSYTGGTIAFVHAIEHTAVANTLIAVAAAPMIAALLGRIFLKERLPRRTWIAIVAVMAGIAVIVADSLGAPRLKGDLSALACASLIATAFVLMRRKRGVSMIPAMAVSGLAAGAAGWAIGGVVVPSGAGLGLLLLLCLFILPFSFAMFALGTRYLPAPEVALIILLEAVLGPYWAWLVIDETPAVATILGGAIVLGTLAWHAVVSRRG